MIACLPACSLKRERIECGIAGVGGSREDLGGVGEGNMVINIFLNCLQLKKTRERIDRFLHLGSPA